MLVCAVLGIETLAVVHRTGDVVDVITVVANLIVGAAAGIVVVVE